FIESQTYQVRFHHSFFIIFTFYINGMIVATNTTGLIKELQIICGEANVFFDEESLNHYGHDETEKLLYPPDVVVKPSTVEQISNILKYCNKHLIPVTPRGAGTGLSGGAIPRHGGIVL